MMTPVKNWKKVLKKAWSMRLMAAAGGLTGAEAVVNAIGVDFLPIPQWARALVILLVIGAAFVARLTAQKEFGDDAR